MTSTSRKRTLVALCILAAFIAVPTAGAAASPFNATKPTKIQPSGSLIAIGGKMNLVTTDGHVLYDSGTLMGTPFGEGTAEFVYTLKPRTQTAIVDMTITTPTGTVSGVAVTQYATQKVTMTFTGVARFTSGTGAYAGIKTGILQFNTLHNLINLTVRVQIFGSTKSVGTEKQYAKLLAQLKAATRP